MAVYDLFKDLMSVAQKADNVDIMKQLIELSQKALELQEENASLRKKIAELETDVNIEEDMIRADEPYYTLKSDGENSRKYYCSTCWGKEKKKIQMWFDGERKVHCPACQAGFSIVPCKRSQTILY